MYEYLTQNSLYIVLIITLVVWLGIYGYMSRIERKIRKLEQELEKK